VNDRTQGGFVLLARKLLESNIWHKPHQYLAVWLYFLLKARHQDDAKLKRGQFMTSLREIAQGTSTISGARQDCLGRRDIWRVCEYLQAEGMAQIAKVVPGILVTICNYDYYQTPTNYGLSSDCRRTVVGLSSDETAGKTVPERQKRRGKNNGLSSDCRRTVVGLSSGVDTFPLEKNERMKQYPEGVVSEDPVMPAEPTVTDSPLAFTDAPATQHDIVALWWLLHERYRGRKPVWVSTGPGNYPRAFHALAAYQRPLRDFERAFRVGFEDSFHRNVLEPAYAAAKFNLLTNAEPRTATTGRSYGRHEVTDAEIAASLAGDRT
jgi:hypothetical protein